MSGEKRLKKNGHRKDKKREAMRTAEAGRHGRSSVRKSPRTQVGRKDRASSWGRPKS